MKRLLDAQHQWPCSYTFKFIVARAQVARVEALIPEVTPIVRPSAKGNYVSVTLSATMTSSEQVLAIYEAASRIEGIISL